MHTTLPWVSVPIILCTANTWVRAPFSDFSCSELSFFRSFLFKTVPFLIFLSRIVLFLIFHFQKYSLSEFLCSELSFFRFAFQSQHFQISPFQNCTFLDSALSRMSFFKCFLFRLFLCLDFPDQNYPFSDMSFPELSLFRFVQFSFDLFQICFFQSCPFSDVSFSELSFFRFFLFIFVLFQTFPFWNHHFQILPFSQPK